MDQRPYEKIIAWQEAHLLCTSLYKITKSFPSEEKFSLVNQMRRSAYGVPMNIAEGNARRSSKEKLRFLEISQASLEELHYQCRLSKDLDYISSEVFLKIDKHIQRVSYLLMRLRGSLLHL